MGDVTQLGPRVVKSRTKEVESKEKVSQLDKEILIKHFICNDDKNPINFPPPRQFVVLSSDRVHRYVYEITENGEVLCSDIKAVKDMVVWAMEKYFYGNELLEMSYQKIMPCVEFWLSSSNFFETPKMISWKNEDCLSFRKLPFEIGSGPTPLFDELMSRISNSKALMAFIGSLLFEESYMHQYVWIQGEGGDGKSSLCRFLDKALGHVYETKNVPSKDDNFWTIGLRNKRLTVFSDCSNTAWVTSGQFKSMTGGDAQTMTPKYGESRKEVLQTKFLFTSNEKPSLTTEKADARRVIYCEISKFSNDFNPKYDDLLFKEGGYFLTKCSEIYLEMCPNHEMIRADISQISDQMSIVEEPYESFFDRYFELSSNDSVKPSEYYALVKQWFKKPNQQAEFRKWLYKTHKIKKTSIYGKPEYEYKGIRKKPGIGFFG